MSIAIQKARRTAKLLFRWCQIGGKLDEGRARQVIEGILQYKGRAYLTVLRELMHLLKLQRATETAKIESAAPLPLDLRTRIRVGLESAYEPRIITAFAQNPGLIGGLRIQIGSDVYDGTVRAKLTALKEQFGLVM